MIIDIPDENSIIKWKYKDTDEWKIAEIPDLIKAYERPKGEWDYFAEEVCGIRITGECPNCKQRRIIDNFCGNCGAIMKGGAPEGLGDD